ncbi:MAG TPA: NAD+ synthase [Spirochaetota bacterium]|nr:NAD+ synthase [Spirochaetota bacterium]HOM38051.1 NAD+ synthase [Spirochaetota bacterium]HPQ48855.1 NAD+ synthase [Spirochaetota bacterium]
MKIAIAQLNSVIGDFENNYNKAVENINRAKIEKADIIIFPELYITGYPPLDLLERDYFLVKSYDFIEGLKQHSQNIAIVIGGLREGLYNTAFFIYNGNIDYQDKTLLPTYDVFDESRYFWPADKWRIIDFKGKRIILSICEDIWDNYNYSPYDNLSGFNLIINISASPYEIGKLKKRVSLMKNIAVSKNCKGIYVNYVGANDELIFDGSSFAVNENGDTIFMAPRFEEGLYFFDLDESKPIKPNIDDNEKEIISALVLGIKDYFKKTGFKKAVLGLSGGMDSALVATLGVMALGSENVKPILLPGPFSSQSSIDDSIVLCKNLGLEPSIVSITEIYNLYNSKLEPIFKSKNFDITEENLQARIRANIILAYSNKFDCLVLNTGNKSEIFSGYSTLYGDSIGALSVIGDLFKTEVYRVAEYINREKEIIPVNIFNKPPSAELRPEQKDEDTLPPYPVLDKILKEYIEEGIEPLEISKKHNINTSIINYVLKRLYNSEYKRRQAPIILKIKKKSGGSGRRYPIASKFFYNL